MILRFPSWPLASAPHKAIYFISSYKEQGKGKNMNSLNFPSPSGDPVESVELSPEGVGPKNFKTTWGLATFLGVFGADRFYLGKVGTGLLKLFSAGGFLVWYVIDLVRLFQGRTRDVNGLALRDYPKKKSWYLAGSIGFIIFFVFLNLQAQAGEVSTMVEMDEGSIEELQEASPQPDVAEETTEEEVSVAPTEEFAWPEMEPLVLEGSGDDVVIFDQPIPAVAAMEVVANASSRYFGIRPILASGESGSTLVNTTDVFNGTVLLRGAGDDAISGFEVTSNGPWTFTIKSIEEVSKLAAGESLEGSGDALIRLDETQGLTTISVVANSESRYFGVRQHGDSSFSVINTTDAYDGTVRLDSGTLLLEVTATGNWQISFSG
jgi:hypothetical protein